MPGLTETASDLGATVAGVQGRAEGRSRSAVRKLDQARNQAAGALRTAASSVRNTAANAAGRLDATASRVEDYDLQDLLAGCRQLIRRNPARSFAAAAVLGFLAASAVRHLLHSCPRQPARD